MRFFALLLTLSTLIGADFERLDIDPALQGLWHAHITSTNKGATGKAIDTIIARVTAGSVKTDGEGVVYKVKSVLVTKDDAGRTCNIIQFSNSTTGFVVSDTKIPGMFLLQIFSKASADAKAEESSRFVISVE